MRNLLSQIKSTLPTPGPTHPGAPLGHALPWKNLAAHAALAIIAFHAAYAWRSAGAALVLYLFCLLRLALAPTPRSAFYLGIAVGLATYAPRLGFFWSIFGGSAVVLWLVLAFWIGLFVLLIHEMRRRVAPGWMLLLVPCFWTGIEYFRSELYYLRFAWLSPGFALSEGANLAVLSAFGVYGVGFVSAALAEVFGNPESSRRRTWSLLVGIGILAWLGWSRVDWIHRSVPRAVPVAGVQVEFPVELDVPQLLDRALGEAPNAELFVLSEYTFDGPVPGVVKRWCREHGRYLVVGGKDPVDSGSFFNTAYVVGPSGEVVFKQAKSVPIQFFQDGLPARDQQLWNSPWGKLGLCICYDLSYSRVCDRLVRLGAQALIVPTMDVMDWGEQQHELHARVAPVRAAEYGIPIFRVASSGVSQLVDQKGRIVERVSYPGQGRVLRGELVVSEGGRIPLDRYVAKGSVAATMVAAGLFVFSSAAAKVRSHSSRHGFSLRL